MELLMSLSEEEKKRRHSAYNTAWKAKHRALKTPIALRLKVKANYYANRDKETSLGYSRYFLNNVKARAKRKGIPFDLLLSDLVIPDTCPVLGIQLIKRRGRFSDESPSLDRMVPDLGYVRGNVQIISYRANRIKCHATVEDLERILAYMKGK